MRFPEHDREPGTIPTGPTCSVERFGGHSGGETPGNIPNPEAKPTSADGTAPETVWESRTPPNTHTTRGPPTQAALGSFVSTNLRPEWARQSAPTRDTIGELSRASECR